MIEADEFDVDTMMVMFTELQGQADPGGSRGEGRAVTGDAGFHRGSEGARHHALPDPRHRRQDGEVSRRHQDGNARGSETRGREAAAVSYVPHVVAWNLTRRCNLECAHCYISAGPRESATSELATAECLRIVDELLAAESRADADPVGRRAAAAGRPHRRSRAYASQRGATVVVGTNGTLLTDERIAALKAAGVRGVAVSDRLAPAGLSRQLPPRPRLARRHDRGAGPAARAAARLHHPDDGDEGQSRRAGACRRSGRPSRARSPSTVTSWWRRDAAPACPISRPPSTKRCSPIWRAGSATTAAG